MSKPPAIKIDFKSVLDTGARVHDKVSVSISPMSFGLPMRIAYFTNQYPAVSHTFIRREIRALEGIGVTIQRYALWSLTDKIVHPEDKAELEKTRLMFGSGAVEVLRCILATLMTRPISTFRAFVLAMKIGHRSDRGPLRHIAYWVEAIVLAAWCRRDNVQHLHAHFGTNSTAIAMLTSLISGISYSFTAHGSEEFEKAPLLALDEKLHNSAFAVCVSSFGRSQLMRWTPTELWNKIELVHCGLGDDFLDGATPATTDAARFVCVGRLGEHKAQLVLVEAVRALRDAGTACEVVLAGDGPMRPQVEAAIRRYGLERQISITGWVPSERVKAEIAAARALILPSFSENMPVVIMEAMALGRPVISTYIAGIPELVQPGKTGWLVPSSDAAALADAMREALAAPVEQLTRMGAAGRARIVADFDASKEAAKLKTLFEKAIQSGS